MTESAPDPVALRGPTALLLEQAASRFGTPCYVSDFREVDRRAAELRAAFPDPWVRQYSLKANPLPAIVARLGAAGFGANVVSAGEWAAARAAGLGNDQITLEGIGKTDADLEAAVKAAAGGDPLRWVTLESADEASRLVQLAESSQLGRGRPGLDVLLRLNPEVQPETIAELRVGAGSSKFGMGEAELREWTRSPRLAESGLRLRGIHVHVGSQLSGTAAWTEAATRACQLVRELESDDLPLDTVDLGGGFPSGERSSPVPAEFAGELVEALSRVAVDLPARAAVEPGRFLVATAGWIVARVLHVRQRPEGQRIVIDASFAELVRPALYGARHPVLALKDDARSDQPERGSTLVEGALCESTDTFGLHSLPHLTRGEMIAIAAAGAYASSMFSHYNGRPRPPEVVIDRDGSLSLARAASAFAP
ncbi:MAG: diaminopimelate decarboxylase family protein [Candidatus Dormibacteria bacterium]